jgi:hypothetical protein
VAIWVQDKIRAWVEGDCQAASVERVGSRHDLPQELLMSAVDPIEGANGRDHRGTLFHF